MEYLTRKQAKQRLHWPGRYARCQSVHKYVYQLTTTLQASKQSSLLWTGAREWWYRKIYLLYISHMHIPTVWLTQYIYTDNDTRDCCNWSDQTVRLAKCMIVHWVSAESPRSAVMQLTSCNIRERCITLRSARSTIEWSVAGFCRLRSSQLLGETVGVTTINNLSSLCAS